MRKVFAIIGGLVTIVGLIVMTVALNGWALALMWGWFVVPLGLPSIDWLWAGGLATIISFLTQDPNAAQKEQKDSDVWMNVAIAFIRPVLTVLFAWGIHVLMVG